MEKTAIGTNDLGMHIVIRPISKDLLSKDEIVGMETGKINSLLTARRPITFVDAISALPPLLPSSADPITGRRLYSVNEIMSGSCGIHFGPPVPELLRYETELSANTVLESSIASAQSAAKRIPCNGQWLTDVLVERGFRFYYGRGGDSCRLEHGAFCHLLGCQAAQFSCCRFRCTDGGHGFRSLLC